MSFKSVLKNQLKITENFGPTFTALIVLLHGVFIIAFTLLELFAYHRHYARITDASVDIPLGVGLSLIYLSDLLRRRKRTAWIATTLIYTFYMGANLENLFDMSSDHHIVFLIIFRALILPGAILLTLIISNRKYVVRSDSQSFRSAINLSLIILLVAFVYGVFGFLLLGKSGFHNHFSVPSAMHYTVDQFGVTINHPLHAYSKKAKLFQDSLSFISIAAVVYVLISFFQPLRSRFGDQSAGREKIKQMLYKQHDAECEDYFKLWPHDKQYFFDSTGESGLAFHVDRGVALVLAGPTGKSARFKQLLSEFQYVCNGNDWRTAIIHASDDYQDIYEQLGFTMQKLGQEAIVDIEKFLGSGIKDKYFRNIVNKFKKQDYSAELLKPPHHSAVLSRLKAVSDEWLSQGGRDERGYAMGYFTEDYMNQCEILVARDAAGTIMAFTNLLPTDFDTEQATYDLLRYSKQALGNVNDFLLISLIQELHSRSYKTINLGLCPLAGMDDDDSDKTLIDSVLGFTYQNADRFYSFSGLYRFKNKYSPDWQDRYVVYQGGLRGYTKTMNALLRTMKRTAKPHHF